MVQGCLRQMGAVGFIRRKILQVSQRSSEDALMRSREFALYAGLVLLPFLLASATSRILPIAVLATLMLLPPAIGWLVAGRGLPVEARLLQMSAGLVLLFIGYLAGFGAGLSLALALLILAEPLLFLPMPVWTGHRIAVALAVLFCVAVVIAHGSSDVRITAFFGPACLAFVPLLVQLIKVLGLWREKPAEPSRSPRLGRLLEEMTLAAAQEAAMLLDRGGRVLATSVNTSSVLRLGAHDLSGRGLFERLHLLDRPAMLKACADALSGAPQSTLALRLRLDPVHSEARIAAYGDIEARFVATGNLDAVAVFFARSKPLLAPLHLGERRPSGLAGDGRQDHAWRLSELSHHLKTPLSAVLGFADLLTNPMTQPKSQGTIAEYGQMIHDAGENLAGIVELLIDMLRLQSGSYALTPEPLSPLDIVEAVRRDFELKTGGFGASLECVGPLPPAEWIGDRKAATQILIALATALVEIQPSALLRVRIAASASEIVFDLSGAGIDPAQARPLEASERDLLKLLPQAAALTYDFARSLASHQGGALSLERRADGNLHAAMRLPLVIDAGMIGSEPVRLDDFRRPDEKRTTTMPREPMVKKHA